MFSFWIKNRHSFGLSVNWEGVWNQENNFWIKTWQTRKYKTCPVGQPDMSGMHGGLIPQHPFSLFPFSTSLSQPQHTAAPLLFPKWLPSESTREMGQRRLDRNSSPSRLKAAHVGFQILSSSSLSRYLNLGPCPVYSLVLHLQIPSVQLLHYLSRSNG